MSFPHSTEAANHRAFTPQLDAGSHVHPLFRSILNAHAALPAANEAAEPLCRYLVIVGTPGERGYQREVIEAFCEDELLTPEKAGVLHDLAQSLGLGFKFRAVTCEDPEHDDSRADEHDIKYHDGRDPDVKVPHYACRWCARCELAREDFAS